MPHKTDSRHSDILIPRYRILSDSISVIISRKFVEFFRHEFYTRKILESILNVILKNSGYIVHAVFKNGGIFEFPSKDRVWRRLITRRKYSFEADLYYTLDSFRHLKCSFFDIGSNLGYWSVIALDMGFRNIIAVEASSDSFDWLQRNAQLNGGQITALHKAIYSRDGLQVGFSGEMEHDQRHITTQQDAAEIIDTITLDTLAEEFAPEGPIIVKLDVEGAELPALQGARELLRQRDVLLIYEDLPRDTSHAPSRFILQQCDWEIFAIVHSRNDVHRKKMKIYKMHDLNSIARIKSIKFSKNFYATRRNSLFHAFFDNLSG